jgi:pyochelin biosynthetic protein PchC
MSPRAETAVRADPALWLDRPVPAPAARYRLICFPHAGGSASSFRDWGARLADFEVSAVRYPGRAERIVEPLPEDLIGLAREIAQAVRAADDDRPLILFGHSMGAAVALETARALEDSGTAVAHLFASGSRDGELPPPESGDDGDDEAVIARLVELGGTDEQSARDPLFAQLVLPAVRADGLMFHSYRFTPEPRLRCPVTAIVGDRDEDADVRPWRALSPAFRERVVAGGHFYLLDLRPFGLLRTELAAREPLAATA